MKVSKIRIRKKRKSTRANNTNPRSLGTNPRAIREMQKNILLTFNVTEYPSQLELR